MNKPDVTLTWEEFSELATAVIAMASAYEVHASRSRHVGRGVADALFTTRMRDFRKASELAQSIAKRVAWPSS